MRALLLVAFFFSSLMSAPYLRGNQPLGGCIFLFINACLAFLIIKSRKKR